MYISKQQTLITESEFWQGDWEVSSADFLDISGVRHWTGDLAHTAIKSVFSFNEQKS